MVRPRKYEEGTTSPLDRITCDQCGGEYTRAHKSLHMKSLKHLEGKKNMITSYNKMESSMSDYPQPEIKKQSIRKPKPILIGMIGDRDISIVEKDDKYYFKVDGKDELSTEIKTKKTPIIALPLTNKERSVVYVCGKSGSGKSTYCRDYLILYKEFYPTNEIYIVSKDGDDPAFKGLGAKRIELDLFSEPVSIDDIDPNCIVVFDDVDSVTDKVQNKNIFKFREQILECGRKPHISALITSHLINKGLTTRNLLNELTQIVLFPAGCSHLEYFLDKHMGFKKSQIKEIEEMKTRYILINNEVPRYVLSKHKLYMI